MSDVNGDDEIDYVAKLDAELNLMYADYQARTRRRAQAMIAQDQDGGPRSKKQRRREVQALGTSAALQQQMNDVMRAPAVGSKAAPVTARGPPVTTHLAATLEGHLNSARTPRAPPPPSLLLKPPTPRQPASAR